MPIITPLDEQFYIFTGMYMMGFVDHFMSTGIFWFHGLI